MTLQFTIEQGGGPPPGFYRSKFVGVEPTTHEEYGTGLKWCFEVLDAEHKGELATRITNDTPTPKNAAGRIIGGLTGESLTAGKRVDLSSCVGKEFLIQVENTKNGNGTRVSTVMPAR